MSQCKFRCWSVYNNNSNNELAMGANSQLKNYSYIFMRIDSLSLVLVLVPYLCNPLYTQSDPIDEGSAHISGITISQGRGVGGGGGLWYGMDSNKKKYLGTPFPPAKCGFGSDKGAHKFLLRLRGAEWRVSCVQTREQCPPSG